MRVRVRLFAGLRESVGAASCEVELGAAPTVGELVARLRADHAALAVARFAVALNRGYAGDATPVREGDEIALIPPVSGG